MTRWQGGEADVEQLLAARDLQVVRGQAADGAPGLARARQTRASAQSLLKTDPTNAFVPAYDATRLALPHLGHFSP